MFILSSYKNPKSGYIKGLPNPQLTQQVWSVRYQGGLLGLWDPKIVIYVKNHPGDRKIGWLIVTPYEGGGVNQRTIYISLAYMHIWE